MLHLVLEDRHIIGQEKRLGVHSTEQDHLAVVFEDDGETGYFYAINTQEAQPVVDSLSVYNVNGIESLQEPRQVQICWSEDGNRAFLLVNGYPHAAFDFTRLIGYNHSKYPLPELGSMWSHENITDKIVEEWLTP
ncbi:DUF2251 domain-containing protein [Basfia succiniciproducens]|uniref:DUF2251 domain-containing protein n=1 Tax=Basfia succiniciproducens TaxID=653940 RepID=UPI0008D2AF4A|nr:DUF2251 domain-containing protein [Basfia succiniciproducens]SEQ10593.1 hypothetical protein SAMN02910415_00952 [Basfia succiniciproducens]